MIHIEFLSAILLYFIFVASLWGRQALLSLSYIKGNESWEMTNG
jgi:hypothetical protein